MSKKSFIMTALIINLTICLTLCIVVFTDKDKADDKSKATVEKSSDTLLESEENTSLEEQTSEFTTADIETSTKETTSKIVESQVSSETQPTTYKNSTTAQTSSGHNVSEQTTVPVTTVPQDTIQVNGSMAIINSSCNIRLTADVGGNVVGTANAGATYRIDASKCSSNWIAIYINDTTVGYISTTFCTIQ